MAAHSILPWLIAQAEQAAAEAPADDSSVPLQLLMAVGIIVGSFIAGGMIARALRLPEFGFKVGVVVFAIVASVAINYSGWPPKLGIDLSGGVVLVYEVDRTASKPSWMPTVIAELNDELNDGGTERVEARPGISGEITIVTPDDFDSAKVDSAIAALRGSQDLTFHSAAEPRTADGKTTFTYAVDERFKAIEMDKLIAAVSRRINPGGVKEVTIRQYGSEQIEVIIPEVDTREVDQIKKRISTSGLLEFRIAANTNDDADIIRAAKKTVGSDVYIGGKLVARWVGADPALHLPAESLTTFRETEGRGREVLARMDIYNVDGGYLDRASPGHDKGSPAVQFWFDSEGAQRFRQLTSRNAPDTATGFRRQLGIILDDVMLSGPAINEAIGASGIISGDFTNEDVTFLVDVLNAGSLPATLRPEPISEQRIGAGLGRDTIYRGGLSMIISTAAILVFMLVYYRWSGLVADIAVTLNIVIVVALMILIKAAFTLPGLAGLVLTVGMAVDANVLIYERMREEAERGSSLRMTIRNGFSRATATIIDANLTTLITAIVLYIIGTDQIKGFAVTLILGLLVSMFTAIFVSRVIFDIAEKKRWLTKLKMMRLVGHTNFDFIRWRTPALTASIIVIAIGLAAAASRGKELLDIDFTGGSSVQLQFAEGNATNIAEVRTAVEHLPDVAVSSMGEENLDFKIDTSATDIDMVEQTLQKAFGDTLQTYSMSFGELATIEAAPEEPAAESEADAPKSDEPAAEAESKPAEPKSDESEPAESKSTDEPADTPEPESAPTEEEASRTDGPSTEESPQSSRRSRRARRTYQFASFGAQPALAAFAVAQDEPAGPASETKEEAKDDSEAPAEEKPAEEKPAEDSPPADEEKPAADASAADVPADTSPQSEPGAEVAAEGNSLVGGTSVELSFPQVIGYEPLAEMIEEQLTARELVNVPFVLRNPEYQPGSDAPYQDWTLSIGLDQAQARSLLEGIQEQLAETPVFPSSNRIGGKVAGDTQLKALYAMLGSMIMIVVYVWLRFQNVVFGLAAVVALLHDVLVSVGFLAISAYLSPYLSGLLVDPFKISLAVVAALLTIVGFSINDTIVTFDRIREVRGKSPELNEEMINLSVNQVLARTLLTSGTVFIASVILFFVGGPGIHAFAYVMVVGVIAGTYSSIYVAAPILLWLKRPPTSGKKAARSTASLGSKAGQPSA